MLGNSFTFANNMPETLANLIDAEVVQHTRGGARLAEQLNPDTKMGGMTQAALESEIGPAGGGFVAVAIFLFAFSSIIGNHYYGEANIRFITPRPWALTLYRMLVGAMVLFGSVATLDLAWSLADVTMALMTLCNLAAIVLLGRQAFLLLADYTAQKRQGIKNPVFTKDRIPELKDKAECW